FPTMLRRALGALPALHSWPQSVGPNNGEQTTSAYARRNEPAYEAAAIGGDGGKPRAIANSLSGKDLALWRMPMDRQLPNRRRPGEGAVTSPERSGRSSCRRPADRPWSR